MTYDLTGRSLYPISDLFDLGDFPLAELLPADQVAAVFDSLYYTEADVFSQAGTTRISARLAIEGELALGLPGTDVFQFVLASGGTGWTSFAVEICAGPELEIWFVDVPATIRISEDVLRDVATGSAAEISMTASLIFQPNDVRIAPTSGLSLAPAYLASTGIVVEADDILPVFGPYSTPEWLTDAETFRGLTIESLRVTIPGDYLQLDSGSSLDLVLEHAAIGTTGFTGNLAVQAGELAGPVTGHLLGFPFRFREFSLAIEQNALIDLTLGVDLRLQILEEGGDEKWVGVDVAFGADGSMSGALSAVQPVGASTTPGFLFDFGFAGVMRVGVSALRIVHESDLWALYFSGAIEVLIDGATWPEVEFEEIGVTSEGDFLLPDGSGISLASPMVVDWHFVELLVTKFRIGYADESKSKLQLGLSAAVSLLEGVPAGASVEGLVVEWQPGSGAAPSIRFSGIGVELGVPGGFTAGISLAYRKDGSRVEFRGDGSLALPALDIEVEVGVVVGHSSFNYLYLFADAKLLPSGIPIGATGLTIYGFQGLLAYNMRLDLDLGLPEDERYYDLFTRPPIGITDTAKWEPAEGQNALGVGVVLGTIDRGFLLNTKGMFVIAFPDLTLLLQARADFLKPRPELNSVSEGSLSALLVYASGQSTLSLDIAAEWEIPILYSVSGGARAFFDFDDPAAWYLELGQDTEGKRITARVLFWGGGWLFSAGYWFRLDANHLVTGIKLEVGLRAEAGGFWVEAAGWAYGEMTLYFAPWQWEGSLGLGGRVGAGYRGLSIGIEFEGTARTRVFEPFDVYVKVEACIHALLWDVCKSFDFSWQRDDPPRLEPPISTWSARPRHWTPRDTSAGSTAALDTGTEVLVLGGQRTVQPHSVIQLDFSKPMIDRTAAFNEAVQLDNGGFVTVGAKSGYSAAYELNAVRLIRDPDGAAEELAVWGTWSRTTLEPNTSLQLFSSERFTLEGSLSYGWLDHLSLDYCDAAKQSEECVPLGSIEPGYGWLEDGSLYHWDTRGDPSGRAPGTLAPGDRLEVIPRGPPWTPEVRVDVDDAAEGPRPGPGVPGPGGPRPGDGAQPRDPCPCNKRPDWLKRLARICGLPACFVLVPALVLLAVAGTLLLVFLLLDNAPRALIIAALVATGLSFLLVAYAWFCDCYCCGCSHGGSRGGRGPQGAPRDPKPEAPSPTAETGVIAPPGSARPPGFEPPPVVAGPPQGSAHTGHGSATEPARGSSHGIPSHPEQLAGIDGGFVILGSETNGSRLAEYCYPRGHGLSAWGELARRGGSKTENEVWTVPASMQILPPGQTIECRLSYTAKLKDGQGNVTTPLGAGVEVASRLEAAQPPLYQHALASYVASVQPSDGSRPVFTGYDLAVQFVEEYVPYLYASVGQELLIRLRDGSGQLVTDATGMPVLVPASTVGPTRTVTEQAWADIYDYNIAEGCVEGPSDFVNEGPTVLSLSPAALELTMQGNSQYTAELVASANLDTALHSWSFTTSRFATFTELVAGGGTAQPPVTAVSAAPPGDFEQVCRALGIPTIGYVDSFTATPILAPGELSVSVILLEAPEPLGFGVRLSARVDGAAASLVGNLDGTRGFLLPASGTWPLGDLQIRLTWQRDAGPSQPVLAVNGDSAPETVSWLLAVPEAGA